MNTVRIYARDTIYQRFQTLKTNRNKRYHARAFFVEGVRNINEAVRNGFSVTSFLYSWERPLSGWAQGMLKDVLTECNYAMPLALMEELSGKTDASELLAIVRMRPDDAGQLRLRDNPLLMLFDRPSNRGNLGSVIRSCDANGVAGLIVTGHAVDVYDPEVITASMGSFFSLPVLRVARQETLSDWIEAWRARYPGLRCIGTTAHAETPIEALDFTGPTLLIIGNETDGMARAFYELCDALATIPMSEGAAASSLNVACAATVLLYEANRQRRLLLK